MPKKLSKKAKSQRSRERALLEKVHLNAAGIDVGAATHWVAVPEDRDENPVRSFGVFTSDLIALCQWLKRCQVETIAMESTGVYWIPLFQVLERNGFEVRLVNASHAKNVPGRKSDVKDCQWLQQLHTFGMLRGSFRPEGKMCVVRSYLRLRDTLSKDCNSLVQRMQKALTEMNIQIHRVISDITGVTGMSILRAILAGERDCIKLAQMRHPQIKSSAQDIAKALEGDYCQEHLFALQTALELYDSYQFKIMECDQHAEKALGAFEAKVRVSAPDLSRLRCPEASGGTPASSAGGNGRGGPDQITRTRLAGSAKDHLRNRSRYEPLAQRKASFPCQWTVNSVSSRSWLLVIRRKFFSCGFPKLIVALCQGSGVSSQATARAPPSTNATATSFAVICEVTIYRRRSLTPTNGWRTACVSRMDLETRLVSANEILPA